MTSIVTKPQGGCKTLSSYSKIAVAYFREVLYISYVNNTRERIMKKSLSDLFKDLSVVDMQQKNAEVTTLYLESASVSAVIAIVVEVATVELSDYDLNT